MKNPRNLLWLIPLLLWLSSPLWKPSLTTFLVARGDFNIGQPVERIKNEHHFIMDEVTITITNRGRTDWEITAQQAYTGDSDRQIELITVHALYKGKGEGRGKNEPVVVISDRGSYFIDKRHLVLKSNVLLRKTMTGEKLRTERLHYYGYEKMLISPTPVVITGPGLSLRAGRMDYDLATGGYKFSNRVKVSDDR
jgi:LPS export ABC transporter protein LptC